MADLFFSAKKPAIRLVQIVDPVHDPFCPLNARFYDAVSDWSTIRHAEKIVCALHVQGAQDGSHNTDHALASFVHG